MLLLVLLLNTTAAAPDHVRLLRSLAITFGALFILKFVVLSELSAPGSSRLKGVLQAMLEGHLLLQGRFCNRQPTQRRAIGNTWRCVFFFVAGLVGLAGEGRIRTAR